MLWGVVPGDGCLPRRPHGDLAPMGRPADAAQKKRPLIHRLAPERTISGVIRFWSGSPPMLFRDSRARSTEHRSDSSIQSLTHRADFPRPLLRGSMKTRRNIVDGQRQIIIEAGAILFFYLLNISERCPHIPKKLWAEEPKKRHLIICGTRTKYQAHASRHRGSQRLAAFDRRFYRAPATCGGAKFLPDARWLAVGV